MRKINPLYSVIAVVILFILLTIMRNSVWSSHLNLWKDAVKKQQGFPKPRTLLNLANAYKELGEYERAEECYRRILQRAPFHHQARYLRAITLIRLKRYREALDELLVIWYFYRNLLPHFPEKREAVERYFKEEDLINNIEMLKAMVKSGSR